MSDKGFGVPCDECGTILREFRDALQRDEQELKDRLHQTANASGRAPDEMRLMWVSSVANAPTDEMHAIIRAQYPRIADLRQKQAEHESRSGHLVFRDGRQTMNMLYEELLKVMLVLSSIR